MNVVESLQKRSTGELSPRQHCRWNDVTARHVKSLRMRAVLTGHTGCVNRMAWNESGTQLVTGIAILKMSFLCNATARSRSEAAPWRSWRGHDVLEVWNLLQGLTTGTCRCGASTAWAAKPSIASFDSQPVRVEQNWIDGGCWCAAS